VARQTVQKLTGLHVPEVDIEAILGGGADDLGRGIDGEIGEREASWGRKGSKVAVTKHVPSSDRAVE